jgi:capsular polysaccharide biosynthesis protein
MGKSMSENKNSDVLSLWALFNILLKYKKLIFGLPVIGALLASLLVFVVLQPVWEASATLEVGRVGGAVAEPVVNVVTRIMLPSFAKGVENSGVINPEELKLASGYLKTIKAIQIKGSDLIELKLSAPSPEMARSLIKGSIVNLQRMQSEIMEVTIERNKKQLDLLTAEMKEGKADTKLLYNKLFASHNWNSFEANLTATVLQNKTTDLRNMTQAKLALEEQLSPSRTYPARVVDDIYISESPVSPKKGLIIGLAILLGLFAGLVVALVHNSFSTKS